MNILYISKTNFQLFNKLVNIMHQDFSAFLLSFNKKMLQLEIINPISYSVIFTSL